MKAVYFHIVGGGAGDMLLASLIDLGCPLSYLKKELRKLPLQFEIQTKILKEKHHVPRRKLVFKGPTLKSHKEIATLINKSRLDREVKEKALKAYEILASAETKIHKKKGEVYFHHLGEIDAILEICGFYLALKYLGIDKIYVSSFPLDKPCPATLGILKGKNINPVNFGYETVTPTAAALLKDAQQISGGIQFKSYGIGWGEFNESDYLVAFSCEIKAEQERIIKIETNIDDMNPQAFETLFDALYSGGAKEAYVEQVIMKKSRPAFVLNVLCAPQDFLNLKQILFEHSTTFGIRYQEYLRQILPSQFIYKNTKLGRIRFRKSLDGLKKETPEYSDCLKIAKKHNLSLLEVYRRVVA
ncbi:MAG: LarC family nickel insertion protein [Candidatus Omnitrophota bacterium]|nr:MAG: LarC family nickel insertion protein [Candidatus Omnitrophota bacterium]